MCRWERRSGRLQLAVGSLRSIPKGNDIAAWNRHLKANCGSDRELLWDLDSGQDFKIPTLPQTAREGWGTPFLLFLTSGLSASPGICCGDLWLAIFMAGRSAHARRFTILPAAKCEATISGTSSSWTL